MAKIIWSEQSLQDLESIAEYISRDSPHYARLFVESIFQYVEMLENFPAIGRKVPEADSESIREIIYKRYRIIYQYHHNEIEILAVIHGSRLISGLEN